MADKILLVVEDASLRDSLAGMVSNWDHTPVPVADAGGAISFLELQRPPLAILDNALSSADGLAMLTKIREARPWTEIIYLVWPDKLEHGAKSLELGASDFLVKPVSPSRLAIAVKRAQDRLSTKRKLAVLSGQPIDDPAAPELDMISEHLSRGTVVHTQLYDTQLKYQQLFDEVPCYISVLDQDFRITALNRRFKEDFGDLLGHYCFDVYQGLCEGCPDCPVADTFRDGQIHQYEQVVTALNGEQYNVLTYTAPIRDSQGEITQVMEMSSNITQIRKLQDHLSSLGMLIGSISHGVKGLITALDGGMYGIRVGLEKKDYDRVMKGWEVVQLMVGRIRRTVLDVLFYAKDRDLASEEVDVGDFARQVAITGENAAKKYGLEFEALIGEDLGSFAVDPNALAPALFNLIENAADACMSDRSKPKHKVIFKASREDDVLVFDVIDDGMGMDESMKEMIFTLFFTSKGSAGTGLGLFIANDTVQQHGGTITVDSEPGQGSHFHVRIPERPRARLRESEEAKTSPSQQQPPPVTRAGNQQ
jgi:PAS domain S-box-containing protein